MITSLRLQNFRSYLDESFEFEPGVNIVVGPNASGKTNLLEAILVLSAGNSYRARDLELVHHKKPWGRLEGFFGPDLRVLKIRKMADASDKEFEVGGKQLKRLNLERTFPAVFFEPNHLQMLTRGPEQRREYIDGLLERTSPGFKKISTSYRRALAQRNALLKKGQGFGKSQLFAWNVRLSELGGQIAVLRNGLIEDINKVISKSYSDISKKKSKVELKYEAHFPDDRYASRMLSKLEKNEQIDFERGFTSSGPHREDIAYYLNGQPVSHTASRGETRSLVLGLKIFELKLIFKARGKEPIMLLDDVFSELDSARRHALVDHLSKYQTIITTTDADAVVEYFTGSNQIIPLS